MRPSKETLHRRHAGAAVAATALLLTGCGTTLGDLPLPAPGAGGDAITVTATFANAMNLPARAKVKLNGADIGQVESVRARDFTADVTMRISADAPLYTDSTAQLRSATPLGDNFVALSPTPNRSTDARRLHDGDKIGLAATTSAASVEDVLGSASLLINGGAVRRLVTVVNGAGNAVGGRGDKIAALLEQSNTLVSRLNARSADIDNAMRNTSELAAALTARQNTLDEALSAAAPATAVIRDNTAQLADLTDGVARITSQINRFPSLQGTDNRSTIADLNQLSAALNEVAADPALNVNTWTRVMPILTKMTSGPNVHAVADIGQLAFGALPDMNYPGDPMFHGADGTDWHAMIGSLRYQWNLLLSRTYGPEHAPR